MATSEHAAAADLAQTTRATTAHIKKNRAEEIFDASGKRTLFFFEELAKFGADLRSRESYATVIEAALAAREELKAEPKDVECLARLYRDAPKDPLAEQCIEKVRTGVYKTGSTAHSAWEKAAQSVLKTAKSKAKKSTKAASKKTSVGSSRVNRAYMKDVPLSEKDLAWALAEAKKISAARKTSGQRSLAMCRKLIERGLARTDQSGGPVSSVEVRQKLEDALGIPHTEIGHGMTFLRRHEAGELPEGSLKALESGRYLSCGTFLKLVSVRGMEFVEVPKSNRWLREQAVKALENGTCITTSAKTLVFLETAVDHHVVDPSILTSRQMSTLRHVAGKVLGVKGHEFRSVWTLLRAVKLGKLPEAALAEVRLGSLTASSKLSDNGGLVGLAKSLKPLRRTAKTTRQDQETVRVQVAQTQVQAAVEPTSDPADDFQSLVSSVGSQLDSILERATGRGDKKLASLAEQFRGQVGLMKMCVSQLVNRRAATRKNRSAAK